MTPARCHECGMNLSAECDGGVALDPPLCDACYDEHRSGERYGFGVCARRTCDEPCGPNGGCIR